MASVTLPWWSRCSKPQAIVTDTGIALLPWADFVLVPSDAQCSTCRDHAQSMSCDQASATRAHILAVSLFCAGLHGSLDTVLRALLAQHIAGDDPTGSVVLDLAEQRGYDTPGMLPVASVAWPIIDQHEHTWMLWRSGEIVRARRRMGQPRMVRRCTCGMFEHEADDGDLHRFVNRDGISIMMPEGSYWRGDPFPDGQD